MSKIGARDFVFFNKQKIFFAIDVNHMKALINENPRKRPKVPPTFPMVTSQLET